MLKELVRPVAVLTWEPSALLAPPAASAFRDQEVGLLKTGLTGTSGIKASRTRTRSRTQTCRSGQGLPNQAGTGEGEGRRTEQLVCTLPEQEQWPEGTALVASCGLLRKSRVQLLWTQSRGSSPPCWGLWGLAA